MKAYKATDLPNRKQKALLKASLNNLPNTPMKELAKQAGVSAATVSLWMANKDFEHWWIMSHYEGARGYYVEKIIRSVCERAIQPNASSKLIELALQILAPERLNKAKRVVSAPNLVLNFVGTDKRLDMPHVEGKLPTEPRLIDYDPSDDDEDIIDVEVDVA